MFDKPSNATNTRKSRFGCVALITASNPVPTTSIGWQRPLPGRYKCNVDVAFSSHLNRIGISICVRDSKGTFVLAKVVSYPCLYSVDVGEALGLHNGLQWLSNMQLMIMSILKPIQRPLLMLFMLLGTTFLNLVVSCLPVSPYLVLFFYQL